MNDTLVNELERLEVKESHLYYTRNQEEVQRYRVFLVVSRPKSRRRHSRQTGGRRMGPLRRRHIDHSVSSDTPLNFPEKGRVLRTVGLGFRSVGETS